MLVKVYHRNQILNSPYLSWTLVIADDDDDETALMFASEERYTEIVGMLIEAGADVNLQNYWGWTALMFAAYDKNLPTVRLLIDAGTDVNLKNSWGKNALYLSYNSEIRRLLLEAGARSTPVFEDSEFSFYTGLGLSGGYITNNLVDIVNNDSTIPLINFILPIQFGFSFYYSDFYDIFNSFSIRGDFSFDFGSPFYVGGTAGLVIDFTFFNWLSLGVGGGYRWVAKSAETIKMNGSGFPYARITLRTNIGEDQSPPALRPTIFVDVLFPDDGNIGINVGFTFMVNSTKAFAWTTLILLWPFFI